jgi:FkbM family methyltransferase
MRALKARFRDQTLELCALRQALKNQGKGAGAGGVALDIGANKGSYLYWLSRWSRGASVVAFEPQTVLAAYLQKEFPRGAFSHLRVESLALSDRCGQAALFVPGESHSHSPGASLEMNVSVQTPCHQKQVDILTLDSYIECYPLSGPVRAIKIDVEGHEAAVLTGAQKTLEKDRPWIVMECEQRHLGAGQSVKQIVETLGQLGYLATFVRCHPDKKPLERPMAEFEPLIHQKANGPRFWDAKDYCNNFIFRPVATSTEAR